MELRVSVQSLVNQSIYYEQQQSAALSQLQQQASSGNRILTPSDDPLGAAAVINYNTQDANEGTSLTNVNTAANDLNVSVSTLQSASNVLVSAKSLATQAVNPGNDQNALNAIATQVSDLLTQLTNLANTQNNGQYVFGGTKTQVAPFVTDASGNVSYVGGTQSATVPVSPTESATTYSPGSVIFQSQDRGASVYTGNTGAAAGTGTDSATGLGTLLVTHTSTTYGGASGVAASASQSAAGDTIIGPAGANTLTVVDTSGNGSAGTVSLNGGTPVAFANTDHNLLVTGPSGEVVYVDTSNIAAGYSSTVPITANGTLSVPGGTPVAINFSANQVVAGPDGTVTNVNSTNIRQAGAESVSYTGTYSAFQILTALQSQLQNTQNLSSRRSSRRFQARSGNWTGSTTMSNR